MGFLIGSLKTMQLAKSTWLHVNGQSARYYRVAIQLYSKDYKAVATKEYSIVTLESEQ